MLWRINRSEPGLEARIADGYLRQHEPHLQLFIVDCVDLRNCLRHQRIVAVQEADDARSDLGETINESLRVTFVRLFNIKPNARVAQILFDTLQRIVLRGVVNDDELPVRECLRQDRCDSLIDVASVIVVGH